jgi:hypothetical protein
MRTIMRKAAIALILFLAIGSIQLQAQTPRKDTTKTKRTRTPKTPPAPPPAPPPAVTPRATTTTPAKPAAVNPPNKSADKAVGTDAKGRTIYEGPRGGRYVLTAKGNKEYIKKTP